MLKEIRSGRFRILTIKDIDAKKVRVDNGVTASKRTEETEHENLLLVRRIEKTKVS